MNKSASYKIFKNSSTTFFTATLFFPAKQRKAIFDLYAFVRVFDDLVDSTPTLKTEYFNLKSKYQSMLRGDSNQVIVTEQNCEVLSNFIKLQKEYNFDQKWIESFFESMEADMVKSFYETMEDTENYIYGSAEVIGLIMAKIMKLDEKCFFAAKALGRAFQYMNMIRDIDEDLNLGRVYFPKSEYLKFGLTEISRTESLANPEVFNHFIRAQIKIYMKWREQAIDGFHYIPSRYLLPINIALNLFDDTIKKISIDPTILFKRKVKPTKLKLASTSIKNILFK